MGPLRGHSGAITGSLRGYNGVITGLLRGVLLLGRGFVSIITEEVSSENAIPSQRNCVSTCKFPRATFSVFACRTALDFHDAGTYTTSSFVRDDLQAYQVLVTVGFCREHTRVSKLFVASECKSVGRVNHIEQMIAMVIFHDTFI